MRVRLDICLVKRGLVESRSEALRLIDGGMVTVGGVIAQKASRLVDQSEPIEILRKQRFVSRGGEKLDGALDHFQIQVRGRSVIDVGASTGGFTDCVLQRGARRVFAVDVGKNQMHERLRQDPRVVNREGVNIRTFDPTEMPFPCSLLVADLSFISLTTVAPKLLACVVGEPGFDCPQLLVLVKPQFEAGRRLVSKGRGVVSDPGAQRAAVERVGAAFSAAGGHVVGDVRSQLAGTAGNIEYLMLVELALGS